MNAQHNPLDPHAKKKRGRFGALRSNFFTGLIVVAPIAVTLWLIWTFIGWIDGWVLPFIPKSYHPDMLIQRWMGEKQWFVTVFGENATFNVRGVGLLVFLIFTTLIGALAKGFLGKRLIAWAESILDRIPILSSLYNGVKQIAETIFAQTDTKFDQACLVQYPREGVYAIAFVSTKAKGEIKEKFPEENDILSVFLPTTPNPTSGFLLFVPRKECIILDMSVEDAAKLIISAGLVYPNREKGTVKVGESLEIPIADRT
ncbi:DUF502 domain-containing protein [Maritimibacter sp. DP1N21-5]|uniref:DUF502 domain-containing protein n=1 Tax=Maritimibacter sp. DP1N21-5 TaxID=2836867 RepID=UPI001C461BDA|nr:DUF502 domain-containing protein [Maritimibacter sp. DP1N21-5]MBV7409843.1 DUF502 domain-containing protein [Maritimibacter sp. DP1N21-5]